MFTFFRARVTGANFQFVTYVLKRTGLGLAYTAFGGWPPVCRHWADTFFSYIRAGVQDVAACCFRLFTTHNNQSSSSLRRILSHPAARYRRLQVWAKRFISSSTRYITRRKLWI